MIAVVFPEIPPRLVVERINVELLWSMAFLLI
jgi:hypothetical protein